MPLEDGWYRARYFDGETALAHDARVRLEEGGLRVCRGRPERCGVWPYGEIVTSGPLLPGEAAVIGLKSRPGVRLQVEEAEFARALLSRLPHAGRKRRHGEMREVLIVLAVLIAIAGGFLLFSGPGARMVALMVPQGFWQVFGEQMRGAFERLSCGNEAGERALAALLQRLRGGAERVAGRLPPVTVSVGGSGVVNAFALPGGHVVLMRGLIDEAVSPDEVAGVLAHELGHVIARHPETGFVRALGLQGLISLLAGSVELGAGGMARLLLLKHSRDAEREADALALRILEAAEIMPRGLVAFLARQSEEKGEGGIPVLLSTHPRDEERLAALRAAGGWPVRPVLDEDQWQALKRICE
jgi:Zn-dependent protease with chaperone function